MLKRLFSTVNKESKLLMLPKSYRLAHPAYKLANVEDISQSHKIPETYVDRAALRTIKMMRMMIDMISRYNPDKMNETKWLNRSIILEALGAVPGMVGGMCRHLSSLRTLRYDNGMIHFNLTHAETERTHLFIWLSMKHPGRMMQIMIALAQGFFMNFFFIAYMISPRYCHRFVGYMEEETVHNYSMMLMHLDQGKLKDWVGREAPEIAKNFYELDDHAQVRDVILAIRADETIHRDVSHRLCDLPGDCDVEQEVIQKLYDNDDDDDEHHQHGQQHGNEKISHNM